MISDKVFELNSFKRQYKALLNLSVSKTIEGLEWAVEEEELLKKINWNNILGIASILSLSEKSEHLEAALRIAQTCISIDNVTDIQKAGAVVVLENLTNTPALKLAISRDLIKNNYEELLPLALKLQTNRIKLENSAIINDRVVSLNRFQKKVYNSFVGKDSLSISAPTSAGKSFILYQLLVQELRSGAKNIVYIVPTRALISQVEEDLRALLKENELTEVNLSTVPSNPEPGSNNNLFVFTQERLHWFLIQATNKKIDFLIVDEAHKIDNGNRGILLQRKIEDVIDINPDVRVFFSSPFTSNPEILLSHINDQQSKETINTEFVAVNQNLLYVTQVKRKPTEWMIDHTPRQKEEEVAKSTLF